jgi:hypothetical protein
MVGVKVARGLGAEAVAVAVAAVTAGGPTLGRAKRGWMGARVHRTKMAEEIR